MVPRLCMQDTGWLMEAVTVLWAGTRVPTRITEYCPQPGIVGEIIQNKWIQVQILAQDYLGHSYEKCL